MLSRLAGVRRKFRSFYQRIILVVLLVSLSIFIFTYLNLEFCYKILAKGSLNRMCSRFKDRKFSGALCEELCTSDTFKDFKCPNNGLKAAVFTAVKNRDVYAIKMAKHTKDDLTWEDKDGYPHYPRMKDFQHIVKRYITMSYNITIDETTIQALLNQEIDSSNPEQMGNVWRLFKDNNYMMGKLFEEETIFPTIFGSCGPFYATENLKPLKPETGLRYYITVDWEGRLSFALMILDYISRLDEVKPDPLKICKIEPQHFGIAVDKRIKYETAQYVLPETQMDKLVASGVSCITDEECMWEHCIGKCDETLHICSGIQQNNNLQIVCQQVFKGTRFFPGILATTKTPPSLTSILKICANPSRHERYHLPNRTLAPTGEIAVKLYSEIKRIHNEITFHQ